MTANTKKSSVQGSERQALPGARAGRPADPDQIIDVTIKLRPRSSASAVASVANSGVAMGRAEFTEAHGADAVDIAKVEAFAHAHGLKVIEKSEPRRTVRVAGSAAALGRAFDVQLHEYDGPGGRYRGRVGSVSVSTELKDIVQGVFGLDDRPTAAPRFIVAGHVSHTAATMQSRLTAAERNRHAAARPHGAGGSFSPVEIAKLYDFPTGVDGSGQCIGILEFGGGYDQPDLVAYFEALGIPVPKVIAYSVDGATNSPTGSPQSADGEVALDIEVAGAIAPGAKIVVYFAPNTDAGFLDAITTAVHDNVNKPSVISISWGNPGALWTDQAKDNLDQAFQDAAALGVSVFCASGDNGSADHPVGWAPNDSLAHADFPSSSTYVTACGGTRLVGAGSTISVEEVWNDGPGRGSTGGGISDYFSLPAYQAGAGVPPSVNAGGRIGRGVPDVCGDASPRTGYEVQVDGQVLVFGGTSAVAPLWADLTALINQSIAPNTIGFFNPKIYGLAPGVGVPGHHQGQQRRLSRRRGLGCLHGIGQPQRSGARPGSEHGGQIVSSKRPRRVKLWRAAHENVGA